MRPVTIAAPALLFAFLCSAPDCAAADTDDSAKDFINRWVATFNQNSPKALLAFYDPSEEIEVLVSSGFRHRGFKALQKAYEDDQKLFRYYDSKPREMSIRVLGDTALVTFEHLFKLRTLQGDSRWQIHIRTTSVLRRDDGKWKIVLEHSSAIQGVSRMVPVFANDD